MYQIRLLNAGKDWDPLDDRAVSSPFEPREGMIYRFRRPGDTVRFTRYQITQPIEVEQEWGDTANGVALVYVTRLPD
jgi:hypothetical protein